MDREQIAEKMRSRITLCRNLADTTHDPETAKALRQIADEGQRDLDRLLREDDAD